MFAYAALHSKFLNPLVNVEEPIRRYISRLYLKSMVLQQTYHIHTFVGRQPLAPRKLKVILDMNVPAILIQLIHEAIRPLALGGATLFVDFRSIQVPDVPEDIVLKNGVLRGDQDDASYLANGFPFYPRVLYSLEAAWRGSTFANHPEAVELLIAPFVAQIQCYHWLDADGNEPGSWELDPQMRPKIWYSSLSAYGASEEARLMMSHAVCGLTLAYYNWDDIEAQRPLAATAALERISTENHIFVREDDSWLTENVLTGRGSRATVKDINGYLDSLTSHDELSEMSARAIAHILLTRIGFSVDDIIFPEVGKKATTGDPAALDIPGVEKSRRKNRIRQRVRQQASDSTYGRTITDTQPSDTQPASANSPPITNQPIPSSGPPAGEPPREGKGGGSRTNRPGKGGGKGRRR